MKNTDAKNTAKSVLGFLLFVGLLIGALFGINVPYEVKDIIPEDTTNVEIETTVDENANGDNADGKVPVEDTENTNDQGVTEDVPQDSTYADTEKENVDNSADTTVAEPTEDETTATEGDVENA